MNVEAFNDEYEYFYDFTPTYDENFVGKKLEDFDLSEEPLAKPITEKLFGKVEEGPQEDHEMEIQGEPMEDIVEEKACENEEDWEDIDVEDEKEEEKASSTSGSFQKVDAPSSTTSFTIIGKAHTNSLAEPYQSVINEEEKSLISNSNLSENEVVKLLERRKKNRFDYQKVTDTYKKATILETGEVLLPNGKTIGHRQWAREYKQKITHKDIKEQMIVQKLSIEYKKKLGQNTQIQKAFDREKMFKKEKKDKKLFNDQKNSLKLGMRGNKVNMTHFRYQFE
jgi:hypothetical protein